jgi:hypothetical protein
MIVRTLHGVCILVVGLLLAASAYRHLDNPYFFLATIYSYQIVGERTGHYLASILPVVQLVITIALVFDNRARSTAFLLAMILFATFLGAQISALVRDLKISCGCFGSADDTPIGAKSLAVAVMGLVFSGLGMALNRLMPWRDIR